MRISDLQNEQKNVSIGGVVTYIGQSRDVSLKSGNVEKVTTITIQDDSGSIPVNIWGSLIEKIKIKNKQSQNQNHFFNIKSKKNKIQKIKIKNNIGKYVPPIIAFNFIDFQ